MLVLSRKCGQEIAIGSLAIIRVIGVSRGWCRLRVSVVGREPKRVSLRVDEERPFWGVFRVRVTSVTRWGRCWTAGLGVTAPGLSIDRQEIVDRRRTHRVGSMPSGGVCAP